MKGRTTVRSVTFARPFALRGFDGPLPAGTYEVETDEHLLEGLSFIAYRRTATTIHLVGLPGQPGLTHAVAIDPADLEAALATDRGDDDRAPGRQAPELAG